jgi:predicted MFS family arabinose efflux permease
MIAAADGWHVVFYIVAGLNITTALLALLALRPLRLRQAIFCVKNEKR